MLSERRNLAGKVRKVKNPFPNSLEPPRRRGRLFRLRRPSSNVSPLFFERKTQMPTPQTKMEQADPLSRDTLQAFDDLFGLYPGFRPTHAKGILLSGTFTPSADVGALTKAPHVSRPSIRVAVRFSDFGGVP